MIDQRVEKVTIVREEEVRYIICDICKDERCLTELEVSTFNPIPEGWNAYGNNGRKDFCPKCSEEINRKIDRMKGR